MMRPVLLLVVLSFLVMPSQARQDAALPDLAPRQVEITGDLTIAFPALRRQPIIGFNPPPRVPDISSSRLPFTEAYAQRSADLPPSPSSLQIRHKFLPLSEEQPPTASLMCALVPTSTAL